MQLCQINGVLLENDTVFSEESRRTALFAEDIKETQSAATPLRLALQADVAGSTQIWI